MEWHPLNALRPSRKDFEVYIHIQPPLRDDITVGDLKDVLEEKLSTSVLYLAYGAIALKDDTVPLLAFGIGCSRPLAICGVLSSKGAAKGPRNVKIVQDLARFYSFKSPLRLVFSKPSTRALPYLDFGTTTPTPLLTMTPENGPSSPPPPPTVTRHVPSVDASGTPKGSKGEPDATHQPQGKLTDGEGQEVGRSSAEEPRHRQQVQGAQEPAASPPVRLHGPHERANTSSPATRGGEQTPKPKSPPQPSAFPTTTVNSGSSKDTTVPTSGMAADTANGKGAANFSANDDAGNGDKDVNQQQDAFSPPSSDLSAIHEDDNDDGTEGGISTTEDTKPTKTPPTTVLQPIRREEEEDAVSMDIGFESSYLARATVKELTQVTRSPPSALYVNSFLLLMTQGISKNLGKRVSKITLNDKVLGPAGALLKDAGVTEQALLTVYFDSRELETPTSTPTPPPPSASADSKPNGVASPLFSPSGSLAAEVAMKHMGRKEGSGKPVHSDPNQRKDVEEAEALVINFEFSKRQLSQVKGSGVSSDMNIHFIYLFCFVLQCVYQLFHAIQRQIGRRPAKLVINGRDIIEADAGKLTLQEIGCKESCAVEALMQ